MLAACTHSLLHLLGAAGHAKVCRGAAHIVNVALKLRVLRDTAAFFQNAGLAAAGHTAALMQLNGAEIASAKAAAILNNGKLYFLNGRNTPQRFIAGVIAAGKGQFVHFVQFLTAQGHRRKILHQILFALLLHHDLAAHTVLIVHLNAAGLGIGHFILAHFAVAGAFHISIGQVIKIREIAGSLHIGNAAGRLTVCQPPGDLTGLMLAHAKADDVCA